MGETTGIWFGENDSLLAEFDEHFGEVDGADYSRSRRVKDAMALAITVDEALAAADADMDISNRGARHAVRSAILNEFRGRD